MTPGLEMTQEPERFDVVVAGSGPAGSLLAWIAARLGYSVLLLEKGRHPRFAIGESSTPMANLVLEELADRYGLDGLRSLSKWGTWKTHHPDLGVGLKRGFSFLRHRPGESFASAPDGSDQLLVAASPRDEVSDTHWLRSDVDAWLVAQARAAGVDYRDGHEVDSLQPAGDGWRVGAGGREFPAGLLVDATGPGGVAQQLLGVKDVGFPGLPGRQALFGHFTGVARVEDLPDYGFAGRTPYPVDDAALHHLFPGAWMWVLRFESGVVSAGVAATDEVAEDLALHEGEPAWARLLDRFPTVAAQFERAEVVEPLRYWPALSHRLERGAGPGWVALPFSTAFVDPILSAGLAGSFLGVQRLARVLEEGTLGPGLNPLLEEVAAASYEEADAFALLVAALYRNIEDFEVFEALTMLYFAGVTQAETRARLGRPVGRFMYLDHPEFGPAVERCCRDALSVRSAADRDRVLQELRAAVAPLDVAGLTRPDRHAFYPVDLDDLFSGADRVDSSPEELKAMLERCGLL